MKYLLDTNVLSERARPSPQAWIVDWIRRHEGDLATAAVVWHELYFGCCMLPMSGRRTQLMLFLEVLATSDLPVLPYDRGAAEWHAKERARLSRLGRIPPFIDGQIAAIAMVNDLELVTLNERDFKAFGGLRLAKWRK